MAFKDVITLRLEQFIEALKQGEQIDINGESKLGDPPIGFDDSFLKVEFLLALNGTRIGFGDLLKEPIHSSEVSESTKIKAVSASILAKSRVKTSKEYEAKMAEKVRLTLRRIVADVAGIGEAEIIFSEPISKYSSDLGKISDGLNAGLSKYLLSNVIVEDLNVAFVRAEKRVLARISI